MKRASTQPKRAEFKDKEKPAQIRSSNITAAKGEFMYHKIEFVVLYGSAAIQLFTCSNIIIYLIINILHARPLGCLGKSPFK